MYEEYDDIEIGSLEGREMEDNCTPYGDSLLQHAQKAEKQQAEFVSFNFWRKYFITNL